MAVRREVDRPLRRDVRWLGRLLGEVLVEQEGDALFQLEERIRALAIERRRGPRAGRANTAAHLIKLLEDLPVERTEPVIRAFAVYFRLVNLAEQHHRIRRARAHARDTAAPPQRGSLQAVLLAAKQAGVPAAAARDAIARLEVTLTLTAHPTEATRRTVLEKLYRIAHALEQRDTRQLTPAEEQDLTAAIREEITALWQTDEVRRERPAVGDEVKNVSWYAEEILWDLLPEIPKSLSRAFEQAYAEPLGPVHTPLRLRSWVGGDMDGNPFVTADVLMDAIRAYHARGLRRLLGAVIRLGGVLSQSIRHVTAPPALLASIDEDARLMPEVAREQSARTEGEPWRRKLRFVEARIAATLAAVQQRRATATAHGIISSGGAPASFQIAPSTSRRPSLGAAYRTVEALLGDLELVADTLHAAGCEHAGERQARMLADRVRALGFSTAELEMRASAEDARAAAVQPADAARSTAQPGRFSSALARIAEAQAELGERACRTLILSMTESAGDVLAALQCARAAGLCSDGRGGASIDIVPLFESLHALRQSPAILRAILADPHYRTHIAQRGAQEVMLGYSDSGKEIGLFGASAALRRAQEALPAVAAEAGIPLRIFHGRGESVARGGGPSQQAILALPAGSVGGRYKATEQGEALDHKYGRPELAMRTLELTVGGALLHTMGAEPRPPPEAEARYAAQFDELAEIGQRVYRALVWEEPRFVEFFNAATPLDEIATLPIGSRPSKRRAGGLEALRAIPWVFAWTQNRAMLPGWYGVGSALEAVGSRPEGRALLVEMLEHWPFFRTVVDNVEMVLAKSDMAIAARYALLAPEAARTAVWPRIREEHDRARVWIKRIQGSRRLLEDNLPLQRSIALRNPYVDPMSFLQVALLRAKRAGDEHCDRPLLLTLNGIAAGMRRTG